MNLEKLKDTARKHEQREDWRKAIDAYQRVIQHFDSGREADADLTIYNRVGDLHLKLNDPGQAVQSYERAAELYAEQGFLNNAIALCGKVLRVNPGRVQVYLQLAHLHARKNVVSEAKRNLIEYMERMNSLGRLDDAFGQLKTFADQHSANQDIRLMLVELLRAASRTEEAQEQLERIAGELEARGDRAGARKTRERIHTMDAPGAESQDAGPNDLIFLETGFEPPHLASRRPSVQPGPPSAPVEGLETVGGSASEVEEPPPVVPGLDTFEPPPIAAETVDADRLADLQSSAFEPAEESEDVAQLDGLVLDSASELEAAAESLVDESPGEADASESDDAPSDEEPFATLDFTVEQSADEALTITSGSSDVELHSALSDADDMLLDSALAPAEVDEEAEEAFDSSSAFVDDFDIGEPLELQSRRDDAESLVEQEEPMLPSADAAEAASAEAAWAEPSTEPEPAAESSPGDLAALDIEELEDLILDDPDDGALHRALGDRLAGEGDLGRAVEEFLLGITAFERDESWLLALDAVDALLTLEPDAIRHQQKRVELAYRSGDRRRLMGAYLGLAEALVRAEALDKAVAVYQRVLEHDPSNQEARAAVDWLVKAQPAAEPPLEQEAANAAAEQAPPAAAPPAAAPPANPRSWSQPADADDYVDLGSMVIGLAGPKDTRMRIDGERPTGDEQKDFQETLEQFKRGIEANLGSEDYEAHYDLGVAFKEMGLLDEAIAEFQKALRAPNGRLRTSEALGITFYDKQQYAIAETILRRAVDALEGGDDEKIGLLYWLGRACESQAKRTEARQAYERALAVDIRFMDLNDRIRQLSAGRDG